MLAAGAKVVLAAVKIWQFWRVKRSVGGCKNSATGRSKETVTYNISLTDLKKRKMAKLNDFWEA